MWHSVLHRAYWALLVLPVLSAGCSTPWEAPASDPISNLTGTWHGEAAWLKASLSLTDAGGVVSGSSTITRNPVGGTWQSADLTAVFSTSGNTTLSGTWQANWGNGTLGGIMTYPSMQVTLRHAGEHAAVARLAGQFDETHPVYNGTLTREGVDAPVQLQLAGALPTIDLPVSSRKDGDRLVFEIGTAYRYTGELQNGILRGNIEAFNAGTYRMDFQRTTNR